MINWKSLQNVFKSCTHLGQKNDWLHEYSPVFNMQYVYSPAALSALSNWAGIRSEAQSSSLATVFWVNWGPDLIGLSGSLRPRCFGFLVLCWNINLFPSRSSPADCSRLCRCVSLQSFYPPTSIHAKHVKWFSKCSILLSEHRNTFHFISCHWTRNVDFCPHIALSIAPFVASVDRRNKYSTSNITCSSSK